MVTTNSTGSLLPWLQIVIMMSTSQGESSFLIAKNGETEGIDGRMGKGPRDGMQEIHTIYKLSANSPCFIIDQKLSPTIYKEKSYGYERWAMRHLFKKKNECFFE